MPPPQHECRYRGFFVVHQHAVRMSHCQLRLELDGVSLSWVLPEGPSMHSADGRLAISSSAYPTGCAAFEGVIDRSELGTGMVRVWDRGRWTPERDVVRSLRVGRLDFVLAGRRLFGPWSLQRVCAAAECWVLVRRGHELAQARDGPIVPSSGPPS